MKTKSKRKPKNSTLNPVIDLFGEVPVTDQEVEMWIAVVAPRWYGSRRMPFYIRDWNIKQKVASAKLAGMFDPIRQQASELTDCSSCVGRFFCEG